MATGTTNFNSAAALVAATDNLTSDLALYPPEAIGLAQIAFDNAVNWPSLNLQATVFNSTEIAGTLSNSPFFDEIDIHGSQLNATLGAPYTINQIGYLFHNDHEGFSATLTGTVTGLSLNNATLAGSMTQIQVSGATSGTMVTVLGSDDVVNGVAAINSIQIDFGGATSLATGSMQASVDATYFVSFTGAITSLSISAGATSFNITGLNLDVNSYISFASSQELFDAVLGGDDSITGNAGGNYLPGFAGNDTLNGGAGADTMEGGTGDDTYLVDNAGDSIIEAPGEGSDTVLSSIGYTLGLNVDDLTLTGTGALSGSGNAGANLIIGNAAVNTLNGLGGDDTLNGGDGNDKLNGAAGADHLAGLNGGDKLNGGAGHDVLIGGTGNDTYLWTGTPVTGTNSDTLKDFVSGHDHIDLDDLTFAGIGAPGAFAVGDPRFFAQAGATHGHDADDRIIYNLNTGRLYFDADGSGPDASVLIFNLTGHPLLVAHDIHVI